MTPSQAKAYLPFVQAAAEGKTIQCRYAIDEQWYDCNEDYPIDGATPENLRIKPEPNLRPWKPEEVPVGAILTWANGYRAVIIEINISTIYVGDGRKWECEDLAKRQEMKHSIDGCKTWLPCGVVEE